MKVGLDGYGDHYPDKLSGRIRQRVGLAAEIDVLLMHEAFSAYDLNWALRIAILRDGTLVQVGTPDDILSRPADACVKRFVEKRASVNRAGASNCE
ncbi:hypothetical protein BBJ41_29305 [Burkholderia stabilis]|uniref:hypothetical protein n=1 Tax=Burkholderia stabilis TaxID=95485 RepID=UPI0008520B44|nr:hypothetical protein [Burkholderia stabilis]AOR71555.1 hypothetical protein BBJ41_29305 [Burkholderia stabilis]